jgi:hypothetical protein
MSLNDGIFKSEGHQLVLGDGSCSEEAGVQNGGGVSFGENQSVIEEV